MALATPVPLPAHLPTSIRANDQRLDIRAVREAVSWVLANDRSVSRDVRSLSAAILSRYAARPVPLDQELERTLAGRNWTAYLSRTVHSFGEAKRLQRLGLHREDLEAFKARMQGRTLAEIAEETGLSTSGVKKRAEKVVAALEEYVRQHRGATDYDHMKFALRRLLDEPPPH
jgi:DNA-binding NarL/FixJ family response regulator